MRRLTFTVRCIRNTIKRGLCHWIFYPSLCSLVYNLAKMFTYILYYMTRSKRTSKKKRNRPRICVPHCSNNHHLLLQSHEPSSRIGDWFPFRNLSKLNRSPCPGHSPSFSKYATIFSTSSSCTSIPYSILRQNTAPVLGEIVDGRAETLRSFSIRLLQADYDRFSLSLQTFQGIAIGRCFIPLWYHR